MLDLFPALLGPDEERGRIEGARAETRRKRETMSARRVLHTLGRRERTVILLYLPPLRRALAYLLLHGLSRKREDKAKEEEVEGARLLVRSGVRREESTGDLGEQQGEERAPSFPRDLWSWERAWERSVGRQEWRLNVRRIARHRPPIPTSSPQSGRQRDTEISIENCNPF